MSSETISFYVPDNLVNKVKLSDPYLNMSSKGAVLSYGIDLTFKELNLSKSIKSRELHILPGKVEETLRVWESKYLSFMLKEHKEKRMATVEELNLEAKEALDELNNILSHTLTIDDAVEWDSVKRKDTFRIRIYDLITDESNLDFIETAKDGLPISYSKIEPPEKPIFKNFKSEYSLLRRLIFGKRIQQEFEKLLEEWETKKDNADKENYKRADVYNKALEEFERRKIEFNAQKERDNKALESIKRRYNEKDPKAIEEYCDIVLSCSKYPESFPQSWDIEFRNENKILLVDYHLPSPEILPKIEAYSYVKARDEIKEKALSETAQKRLFDSVVYQICIRTIHELFEADVISEIDVVVFNGLVTEISPATGIEETKTIISVSANKQEFLQFDLSKIDPKATFKHMKGVAARTLAELASIPPVMRLEKTDKRIIEGKTVNVDESMNIAAMDWEDFEHLVRELFEQEFTSSGGEVKVTRASADGGVDAIAFDPDPIRGGKIVIQAKRYTNVVGVAAVRDLYGTVMNEGATKGILVTTSDYGRDSYDFAKDKPLTLLNGSNLLSLLERHGRKARINIEEAKKLMK